MSFIAADWTTLRTADVRGAVKAVAAEARRKTAANLGAR
jgi:hypothetical protein